MEKKKKKPIATRLPDQWKHVKGFQSGQEEEEVEPPLSDPCWEGSRAQPREAAGVLWSHLMVGKANNT